MGSLYSQFAPLLTQKWTFIDQVGNFLQTVSYARGWARVKINT
jgi:hypothetical protein